jgi:hypothetical protein
MSTSVCSLTTVGIQASSLTTWGCRVEVSTLSVGFVEIMIEEIMGGRVLIHIFHGLELLPGPLGLDRRLPTGSELYMPRVLYPSWCSA